MITTKKISHCRICDSTILESQLVLKSMPFTDEFLSKEKIGKEYLADIEIGICKSCGSVQNLNDTDMFDYYNEYTYTVQSSAFAMEFMSTLAGRVKEKYFQSDTDPKVLEIGSGSGEQLLEFKKIGFSVIGIEPSEKLSNYANSIGVKTITSFFDENTKEILDAKFASVDLVVSSYTFDHIPRPVEVLNNIYNILDDNGILMTEVHDLSLIKQRNEFCLFEHEHYTYLDETTMTQLLERTGFKVLDFELLSTKEKRGNSLLVIAQKTKNLVPQPIDLDLAISSIRNLSRNTENSIANLQAWLNANSEKQIVAYGAGGRGIMTIAALNDSSAIKYIVDKNPKGKSIYAPKSHLPVFPIDQLRDRRADIIIVFSFGYYNEIVEEVCRTYNYNPQHFISILNILKK